MVNDLFSYMDTVYNTENIKNNFASLIQFKL